MYIKPPKLAKLLDVSETTIYNWIKEGKLKAIKIGNRWAIPESEVAKLLNQTNTSEETKICVIYCRVSGNLDNDLQNQVELCKAFAIQRGFQIKDVIKDKASSFNFKRSGLQKLLNYVINKEISAVIVYSKDRLSRVAFDLFETLFSKFGVEIIVIDSDEKSLQDWQIKDLVDELVSFIHYITSKLYGLRSYRKKLQKCKECMDELQSDKNPKD